MTGAAVVNSASRPRRRVQFRVDSVVAASSLYLIALLVLSYLVPHFLHSPNDQNLANGLKPPIPFSGSTWSHPLGTDELGRDVLARLAAGARTSLSVSLSAVAIAGPAGAVLGMLAGFWSRRVDFLVQLLIEVQVSFPGLLIAILFLAVVGPSVGALVVVLALLGWMVFARSARAGVLSQRRQEYVQSAYAVGASSWRVLFRHIGPTLLPTLAVIAALETAQNMLAESALSFLGLGIQPPGVSWGLMMADGQNYMIEAWWLVVLPGLAIVSTVFCVMMLAEVSRRKVQDR